MSLPRIAIDTIRDLLRLKLEAGLSHSEIAAVLNVSKGVVSKYANLAEKAHLKWQAIRLLDDADLAKKINAVRSKRARAYAVPDYSRIHHELRQKGATRLQLWDQYKTIHGGQRTYQYTQFCERYRVFVGNLRRSMRPHHCAGEKMFIAFARHTVPLQGGGNVRLFVAVMGASHMTFACATGGETIEDWIASVERAFLFFGGAPKFVVTDRRQALIAEPAAQRLASNKDLPGLARFYGTAMLSATHAPVLPEGNAASAVQVAMRWMSRCLRHQQELAGVKEVNQALQALMGRLNQLTVKRLLYSRAAAFALLDAPLLFPLPIERYEVSRSHAEQCEAGGSAESQMQGRLVVDDGKG